jgi:hypothetical protein
VLEPDGLRAAVRRLADQLTTDGADSTGDAETRNCAKA